ncbi:MAG: hypothetical protein WEB87_05420, partial [Bacteriovoracaceae bacterium]
MKKPTIALCLCLLFFSCAKTDEVLVDSANQEAKYYLTNGKCSDAKKILDSVGYQSDDAVYIGLYA